MGKLHRTAMQTSRTPSLSCCWTSNCYQASIYGAISREEGSGLVRGLTGPWVLIALGWGSPERGQAEGPRMRSGPAAVNYVMNWTMTPRELDQTQVSCISSIARFCFWKIQSITLPPFASLLRSLPMNFHLFQWNSSLLIALCPSLSLPAEVIIALCHFSILSN